MGFRLLAFRAGAQPNRMPMAPEKLRPRIAEESVMDALISA